MIIVLYVIDELILFKSKKTLRKTVNHCSSYDAILTIEFYEKNSYFVVS